MYCITDREGKILYIDKGLYLFVEHTFLNQLANSPPNPCIVLKFLGNKWKNPYLENTQRKDMKRVQYALCHTFDIMFWYQRLKEPKSKALWFTRTSGMLSLIRIY